MTARTDIRVAVVAAVTGLATSGARVYEGRADPLPDAALPGLIVTDPDELIDDVSPDDTPERQLFISVAAHAKGEGAVLSALLDQMAGEIEVAIEADATLDGLTGCVRLASSPKEISDEGERTLGRIVLNYICHYGGG